MLTTILQWLGAASDKELREAAALAQLCTEQASHPDRSVREALAANITCMARPPLLAALHTAGSPQGTGKPDGLPLLQVRVC